MRDGNTGLAQPRGVVRLELHAVGGDHPGPQGAAGMQPRHRAAGSMPPARRRAPAGEEFGERSVPRCEQPGLCRRLGQMRRPRPVRELHAGGERGPELRPDGVRGVRRHADLHERAGLLVEVGDASGHDRRGVPRGLAGLAAEGLDMDRPAQSGRAERGDPRSGRAAVGDRGGAVLNAAQRPEHRRRGVILRAHPWREFEELAEPRGEVAIVDQPPGQAPLEVAVRVDQTRNQNRIPEVDLERPAPPARNLRRGAHADDRAPFDRDRAIVEGRPGDRDDLFRPEAEHAPVSGVRRLRRR